VKLRICLVGTATESDDGIAALDMLFAVTWTSPFRPVQGAPRLGRRWVDAQASWSTGPRSAAESAALVDLDELDVPAGGGS
jgi:hypothetical protein